MPTDLKLHVKGWFSCNSYIFRNVREHSITYIDRICLVSFNYTPKTGKRKGKDTHYDFQVPIDSLYYVGVRNYE